MTDPDRLPKEPSRDNVALWILVGLMVLIAVGGWPMAWPILRSTRPIRRRPWAPPPRTPGPAIRCSGHSGARRRREPGIQSSIPTRVWIPEPALRAVPE